MTWLCLVSRKFFCGCIWKVAEPWSNIRLWKLQNEKVKL